jgi:hypothetical protein
MNKLSEFSDSFDRYVSPKISFLNNEYVNAFLMIILITYASLAAPRLPRSVAKLFENPLTKLIIFFLIVYTAKHNAGVAIIASIAVLVSLMTLNRYVHEESMSNLGTMESNLDKCNGWDCQEVGGENIHEPVNEVEGNESEITEKGYPVDFSVAEKEVVQLPQIQNVVNSKKVEQMFKQEEAPVEEILKQESETNANNQNILSSSIAGVKSLLKKANIIEGYENSDSSSYSDF